MLRDSCSFTCNWVIVLCFDLQSLPIHENEVDQSGRVFCSCSYLSTKKMSMECMVHLFFSFFGKISVYPHTILHKSRSHRGNLSGIVTPLPSFIQYCKRNELLGCTEILPDLTSSKFWVDGDVSFLFGTRDSLIKISLRRVSRPPR